MRSALNTSIAERRSHRRVPLVCDVWQRREAAGAIPSPQAPAGLAGRTLNLSAGGAMIRLTRVPTDSPIRPQAGQDIDLTLALPRATADTFLLEHVKLSGQVVRVRSACEGVPCSEFAVRFTRPVDLQLD